MHAAAMALDREAAPIDRANSYMAVMVDDLTLQGVNEPYRMLTARAEYRLRLRANNASTRLTHLAITSGANGSSGAKSRVPRGTTHLAERFLPVNLRAMALRQRRMPDACRSANGSAFPRSNCPHSRPGYRQDAIRKVPLLANWSRTQYMRPILRDRMRNCATSMLTSASCLETIFHMRRFLDCRMRWSRGCPRQSRTHLARRHG